MMRQKFKMSFSSDKFKLEFKSQYFCYETWNVSHHFLNAMQLTHKNASGRWWTDRKYGLCCHKMFALKPTHCFSWVSQETEHPFYFDSWQPWRKCHGQKGMVAVKRCQYCAVILEVLPLMHVYSLPKTMGIYACLLLKILYAIKCLILPILWPLPANLHSRQITVTIQFLCTGRCVANSFWMVSRVLIY